MKKVSWIIFALYALMGSIRVHADTAFLICYSRAIDSINNEILINIGRKPEKPAFFSKDSPYFQLEGSWAESEDQKSSFVSDTSLSVMRGICTQTILEMRGTGFVSLDRFRAARTQAALFHPAIRFPVEVPLEKQLSEAADRFISKRESIVFRFLAILRDFMNCGSYHDTLSALLIEHAKQNEASLSLALKAAIQYERLRAQDETAFTGLTVEGWLNQFKDLTDFDILSQGLGVDHAGQFRGLRLAYVDRANEVFAAGSAPDPTTELLYRVVARVMHLKGVGDSLFNHLGEELAAQLASLGSFRDSIEDLKNALAEFRILLDRSATETSADGQQDKSVFKDLKFTALLLELEALKESSVTDAENEAVIQFPALRKLGEAVTQKVSGAFKSEVNVMTQPDF